MIRLNCIKEDSVFYIEQHGDKRAARSWAILEPTKYGPKQFDTYFTKEQAETAAKHYGLTMIDKPTGP